jgi:uncharacterized Zn-binding protein involved in type VI secretion
MPAAARVGDQTDHGTPLTGTGSSKVFIEQLPAWRAVVDFHMCPVVEVNKPHGGGWVFTGSTKVRIDGFAAAREGDQIVETGASSPNRISAGSTKVSIGG